MPEGGTPSLEQEIADIEQELAQKRELLREQGKELPHDKEILHSVVREKLNPATPVPSAPGAGTGQVPPPILPPELHQKVQALVNVAFLKSIDEAIAQVKATNNAALIDAFHDVLVDELYAHLVERGKLKPR